MLSAGRARYLAYNSAAASAQAVAGRYRGRVALSDIPSRAVGTGNMASRSGRRLDLGPELEDGRRETAVRQGPFLAENSASQVGLDALNLATGLSR
jgi:hypothetical protein